MTHADLRKALWPDAVAGGTTLARPVAEVREAVGDEASAPRIVRTVQRYGYAFCGSVTDNAAASAGPLPGPALGWGTMLVPLAYGANLIGRAPGALISVASTDVSRRHAEIVVSDEGVSLEDLGSRHGTLVAGKRIDGRVVLKDHDEIVVGSVTLDPLFTSRLPTSGRRASRTDGARERSDRATRNGPPSRRRRFGEVSPEP